MQTILLVENDTATLVACSLILRGLGYTVLEAADRGEVWRVCHEHPGQVHVVMMNAILDNGSTREFVARLQLLYPQIRALFASDRIANELGGRQSVQYQYAYLQKPFRANALADTMRKLLDEPKTRAVSSFA